MNLYFTYESRVSLKSFVLFIIVKTITKLNLGHCDKFEKEILQISRRGSRSSANAEFSHFTLLFCRERHVYNLQNGNNPNNLKTNHNQTKKK